MTRTKLSPLSLVKLAGSPAGSACWKTSSCPWRAALYMRVAKADSSGGMAPFEEFSIVGNLVHLKMVTFICDGEVSVALQLLVVSLPQYLTRAWLYEPAKWPPD